jgi:hypothetical protein
MNRWRPENWQEIVNQNITTISPVFTVICTRGFEAGADAMLEALRKDSSLMRGYLDKTTGAFIDERYYTPKEKAKQTMILVFIPDDEGLIEL